jgi:hypothetical protein
MRDAPLTFHDVVSYIYLADLMRQRKAKQQQAKIVCNVDSVRSRFILESPL